MAPQGAPKADAKSAAAAKAEAKKAAKAKAEAKAKKEEPRPEDLLPKVEPVNAEEFDTKLEKVQETIEKLQVKQKDVQSKMQGKGANKGEFSEKRNELLTEMRMWSQKMDEVKAQRDEISTMMGNKKEEVRQMKDDLRATQNKMPYKNEQEINDRIRAIEFEMHSTSMPLKKEKDLMKEIAELKKSKSSISKVSSLEANLQSASGAFTDQSGVPLADKKKALNEEFSELYARKKEVSEQLTALTTKRDAEMGDLPELIKQKEEISKGIQEQIRQRNAIKSERREAEQAYYHYQTEVRQLKQERARKEREERNQSYDMERKKREAEKLDEQPHVAEITLIDQTIAFCKSLTDTKGKEEKEEKKEIAHTNKAEEVVLLKKSDRDEEFFFAPTKAKKAKGKKADPTAGKAKPIKHNAETFQLFDKLKLDAPITTDDVPALLEKLEEQLKEYKEKVKVWEAKKEELKRSILEGTNVEEKEETIEEKTEAKEEAKDDAEE